MKNKSTSLTALTACLALLCATSVRLRAATITVTNTADSGPGTLRAALAGAASGDTIDATGVSGAITLTSGQLDVPNSVTVLGPGPGVLMVSGNTASRVFNVTGAHVAISGLSIANGYGATNGTGINAGGNPGSLLTVSGCVITNNSTTLDGGGIYNSPGVTMTVTNCTVSGNTASGNGGGICSSKATLMVLASSLNGNSAGSGGAIMNDCAAGTATLTINATSLNGNSAGFGGGIMNYGPSGSAILAVVASTISSNLVSYSGGGILNYGDSGSATLTINASTISDNSAYTGGGIDNNGYYGSATVTVNASTFGGNSAGWIGGSILNEASSGVATLEIGDTILNAANASGNIFNAGGTVTSDGYNLSNDDGSGFLGATNDQVNTDPKLGPLQGNGGPTWTHALLPGSRAIDNGKTNAVPGLARSTDQRGRARPVDNLHLANATGGDGSDIGAFEVQYALVTNTADSGPGSLRQALAAPRTSTPLTPPASPA